MQCKQGFFKFDLYHAKNARVSVYIRNNYYFSKSLAILYLLNRVDCPRVTSLSISKRNDLHYKHFEMKTAKMKARFRRPIY